MEGVWINAVKSVIYVKNIRNESLKISSVSQMREMDRTAVETFGIEEKLLMENAGYAAFEVLSDKHKIENRRFAVICGIGNNGGDGFVIARKIHSAGGYPIVFILGDKSKFKGAAKLNLDIITKLPVKIYDVTDAKSVKKELVHLKSLNRQKKYTLQYSDR